MNTATYPPARDRSPGPVHPAAERYERYEEVTGAAGTGGAFVELGRFSGKPDAIDLISTGGDALVRLRSRDDVEESSVRVIQNVPRSTYIAREIVEASNVSDAAPATVRATGKWHSTDPARRYPPADTEHKAESTTS